jgi:hypothetical protein
LLIAIFTLMPLSDAFAIFRRQFSRRFRCCHFDTPDDLAAFFRFHFAIFAATLSLAFRCRCRRLSFSFSPLLMIFRHYFRHADASWLSPPLPPCYLSPPLAAVIIIFSRFIDDTPRRRLRYFSP